MMARNEPETARQLIESIRSQNGGISQEDREYMQRERPHILEALDNVRSQLGASTRTLATELYTKNARFVFELIQNAEDNHYNIARQDGDIPWIQFTLTANTVLIDTNEDGFTTENIKAICSVSKSTKSNVQGYIGEKGIGFKAVFKVSRKVHIQSRPYSFAFDYDRDSRDNGLGMVTPFWEPPVDLPVGVRTRITLYLLDNCDRVGLRNELLDLPDTLLLFLKQLRKLVVRVEIAEQLDEERTYVLERAGDRASIRKTVQIGSQSSQTTESLDYWISRRLVTNMPNDPNRQDIDKAEVVLAFPLDSNEDPITETQHTFAFLPMRKIGFKFLIQSDFMTQANREDVVDNPWNRRLIKESSYAFTDAVNGFMKHPTLRYTWIRFVPVEGIADDFWRALATQTVARILDLPLFLSRTGHQMLARNLRIVGDRYRDEANLPLVPDLSPIFKSSNLYLSDNYSGSQDQHILSLLNVVHMTHWDFLERVSKDLLSSPSHLRSQPTSAEAWHTKMAARLREAFTVKTRLDDVERLNYVKKLPIVPLTSGTWVRPLNASIFFPSIDGATIPHDLSLSLVSPDAASNPERRRLFERLGVLQCDPLRVFPLIEQAHASTQSMAWEEVGEHVKFLHWHNASLPSTKLQLRMPTATDGWRNFLRRDRGWVYSPDVTQQYSLGDILRARFPIALKGKANFVHKTCYRLLRTCERRNGISGMSWFEAYFEIKHTVQLHDRASQSDLSPELQYIAMNRPGCLLHVLSHDWSQYRGSQSRDSFLGLTKVPVLDSTDSVPLNLAYLPLTRLKDIAERIRPTLACNPFKFVAELDGLSDSDLAQYAFLKVFGVGVEEDVNFWLTVLSDIHGKVPASTVIDIYRNLQKFTRVHEVELILQTFRKAPLVYVPSGEGSWSQLDEAVWKAPAWYGHRTVLSTIEGYHSLYSLFVHVLQVPDADTHHFLEYLSWIKDRAIGGNFEEEDKIVLIYKTIYEDITRLTPGSTPQVTKDICQRFIDEKLIFYPQNRSWCSPSQCIWAEDNIQLPGKISLATAYRGIAGFFTHTLGIVKPTLELHLQALKQKVANAPEKITILQEIRNICAFELTKAALSDLHGCKCFPIRSPTGDAMWVDRKTEFVICDRQDYGNAFRGKLTTLDLSLEESHSIRPFLEAMGLQDRFLSDSVESRTSVEGGSLRTWLTERTRTKAHAICRYAAHMNSRMVKQDPLNSLSHLEKIEVYVSDNITKVLSMKNRDSTIEVPQEQAFVHLSSSEESLKLYIPRRKRYQHIAFAREVPMALLRHFQSSNLSRVGELGSILTASGRYETEILLQQAGIIEVAGLPEPPVEGDQDSDNDESSHLDTDDRSGVNGDDGDNTASTVEEPTPTHSASLSLTSQQRIGNAPFRETPLRIIPTEITAVPRDDAIETHSVTGISAPDRTSQYVRLLDKLIEQARGLAALPTANQVLLSSGGQVALDVQDAVASSNDAESNYKLGAAGELFVYELLCSMRLQGFSEANWRSTIRHRVCVHERYRNLGGWSGHETADIVYEDTSSDLTSRLIQLGYLDRFVWLNRSVTYYIEVKATPRPLEHPFFCSQSQVDRMENMRYRPFSAANNVYLIARVFDLGSAETGLKLYLDPARLRDEQKLRFSANTYAVTPCTPLSTL